MAAKAAMAAANKARVEEEMAKQKKAQGGREGAMKKKFEEAKKEEEKKAKEEADKAAKQLEEQKKVRIIQRHTGGVRARVCVCVGGGRGRAMFICESVRRCVHYEKGVHTLGSAFFFRFQRH